jgi:hypothetical protein
MDAKLQALRDRLLYGNCYAAAIVLSDELNWPIGALKVDIPRPMRNGWQGHLVHSFLISPCGSYYDAATSREFRNPRIVEFTDATAFRNALRCLYMDEFVDSNERTKYDEFLDDQLPSIRRCIEELDLVNQARMDFSEGPRPA